MFIVKVGHHVKPGRIEDAKRTMTEAGAEMAASEGFVFRFLVTAEDDPLDIQSFTGWLTKEHMERSIDAFRASGKPWPDPTAPESPYNDVTRRHFDVAHFVLPEGDRTGDRLQFALRSEELN